MGRESGLTGACYGMEAYPAPRVAAATVEQSKSGEPRKRLIEATIADGCAPRGDDTAGWRSPSLAVLTSVIALHVKEGGFPLYGVDALAIGYDKLLAVSTALGSLTLSSVRVRPTARFVEPIPRMSHLLGNSLDKPPGLPALLSAL